jgi:hypothetical protein
VCVFEIYTYFYVEVRIFAIYGILQFTGLVALPTSGVEEAFLDSYIQIYSSFFDEPALQDLQKSFKDLSGSKNAA